MNCNMEEYKIFNRRKSYKKNLNWKKLLKHTIEEMRKEGVFLSMRLFIIFLRILLIIMSQSILDSFWREGIGQIGFCLMRLQELI